MALETWKGNNMRIIEKLRLQALRACANRKHSMKEFVYQYNARYISHWKIGGFSSCRFCNASVTIVKTHQANQCSIIGDAVAVECKNIYYRKETT